MRSEALEGVADIANVRGPVKIMRRHFKGWPYTKSFYQWVLTGPVDHLRRLPFWEDGGARRQRAEACL